MIHLFGVVIDFQVVFYLVESSTKTLFSLYLFSNTCFTVIFSVVISFVKCLRALSVLFLFDKEHIVLTYYLLVLWW